MRTFLLVLLLATTVSAQDLSWMSGHWITDDSEEVWSESRDGNLMGYNRKFEDDEVVFFEHLRIERSGSNTVYQACPLGQSWTGFRLTKIGESEALFSNPQHDFPQHINYRREGDSLLFTISGAGEKSASWRFQRKP